MQSILLIKTFQWRRFGRQFHNSDSRWHYRSLDENKLVSCFHALPAWLGKIFQQDKFRLKNTLFQSFSVQKLHMLKTQELLEIFKKSLNPELKN